MSSPHTFILAITRKIAARSSSLLETFLELDGDSDGSISRSDLALALKNLYNISLTRVQLNGRTGDSPGRLVSTVVGLELAPDDLSTVIDTLRVYRDSGSGEFEADEDFLVETIDVASFEPSGGVYLIRFPADDPNTIIAAPITFFIAGDVTAGASTSGFASLTVTNRVGNTLMNDANAVDRIRLSAKTRLLISRGSRRGEFSSESRVPLIRDMNPSSLTRRSSDWRLL